MRITIELGRQADTTLQECMSQTGKSAQSFLRKLVTNVPAHELVQILSRFEGHHDNKEKQE